MAILPKGSIIICDTVNKCLKEIDIRGNVCIFAQEVCGNQPERIKYIPGFNQLLVGIYSCDFNQEAYQWWFFDPKGNKKHKLELPVPCCEIQDIAIDNIGNFYFAIDNRIYVACDSQETYSFQIETELVTPHRMSWACGLLLLSNTVNEVLYAYNSDNVKAWKIKNIEVYCMSKSPIIEAILAAGWDRVHVISSQVNCHSCAIYTDMKTTKGNYLQTISTVIEDCRALAVHENDLLAVCGSQIVRFAGLKKLHYIAN